MASIDTGAIRATAFVSNDSEINILTHPCEGGSWGGGGYKMCVKIKIIIIGRTAIALQLLLLTFSVRHLNAIKSTVGRQWT
jgi:hypothetical protein